MNTLKALPIVCNQNIISLDINFVLNYGQPAIPASSGQQVEYLTAYNLRVLGRVTFVSASHVKDSENDCVVLYEPSGKNNRTIQGKNTSNVKIIMGYLYALLLLNLVMHNRGYRLQSQ